MSRIAIGATYLRQNTKRENVLTPILPLLVRVSLSAERSSFHPAKIEISMPPRGRSMLDDVKSKNAKKFTSNNPKKFKSLK